MSASDIVGEALTLSWPEPRIALATFTRAGEMNTLSLALIRELNAALDIATAEKARALILTGSGRAFCCGAHIRYFTDADPPIGSAPTQVRDNYLAPIAELYDRLEVTRFPVIAAINGYALGGGCEMAISCDFRLLSTEAIVGLPETRIGATPGAGGVQKLHRLIGRGRAMDWILLGRHVKAAEALEAGFATALHAPEGLLPAALALARTIIGLSPMAIAQAKTSVTVCGDLDLASARRFGLESLTTLIGGPDWVEGMGAFREKRPPKFA